MLARRLIIFCEKFSIFLIISFKIWKVYFFIKREKVVNSKVVHDGNFTKLLVDLNTFLRILYYQNCMVMYIYNRPSVLDRIEVIFVSFISFWSCWIAHNLWLALLSLTLSELIHNMAFLNECCHYMQIMNKCRIIIKLVNVLKCLPISNRLFTFCFVL